MRIVADNERPAYSKQLAVMKPLSALLARILCAEERRSSAQCRIHEQPGSPSLDTRLENLPLTTRAKADLAPVATRGGELGSSDMNEPTPVAADVGFRCAIQLICAAQQMRQSARAFDERSRRSLEGVANMQSRDAMALITARVA